MKSDFFERHTRPAIDRNTSVRIPWNDILGQSLDAFTLKGLENNKSEQQIVADIINNHAVELAVHTGWHDKLLNNVGSRASRFRGELKQPITWLDPAKRASAIESITEMLDRLPSSEEEYKFKLEAIRGLLE